jgi:predicted RNase H-like nuclease (RuvC/YqgF family)
MKRSRPREVNVLVKKLDQAYQTIETLERRISHLEKLLVRFSVVPKFSRSQIL